MRACVYVCVYVWQTYRHTLDDGNLITRFIAVAIFGGEPRCADTVIINDFSNAFINVLINILINMLISMLIYTLINM